MSVGEAALAPMFRGPPTDRTKGGEEIAATRAREDDDLFDAAINAIALGLGGPKAFKLLTGVLTTKNVSRERRASGWPDK
jgi:hypothetical protein